MQYRILAAENLTGGAVLMQTFLRLSKPQKDKLAAIYGAHVQQLSELRSECISVVSKLQVYSFVGTACLPS